jgi:hypothetical protein
MKTGFGWIEARTVRYDHDVVIHIDGFVTKRKKNPSKGEKEYYGHTSRSDIEIRNLADERPDRVFIGTEQYGDLPVTPAAEVILQRYHAVIRPTPEFLPLTDRERAKCVPYSKEHAESGQMSSSR